MGPLLSEIAAAGRCKVGCNIIPAGNCEPSYCVPLECLFLTLIVKVSIPTETFLLLNKLFLFNQTQVLFSPQQIPYVLS